MCVWGGRESLFPTFPKTVPEVPPWVAPTSKPSLEEMLHLAHVPDEQCVSCSWVAWKSPDSCCMARERYTWRAWRISTALGVVRGQCGCGCVAPPQTHMEQWLWSQTQELGMAASGPWGPRINVSYWGWPACWREDGTSHLLSSTIWEQAVYTAEEGLKPAGRGTMSPGMGQSKASPARGKLSVVGVARSACALTVRDNQRHWERVGWAGSLLSPSPTQNHTSDLLRPQQSKLPSRSMQWK